MPEHESNLCHVSPHASERSLTSCATFDNAYLNFKLFKFEKYVSVYIPDTYVQYLLSTAPLYDAAPFYQVYSYHEPLKY